MKIKFIYAALFMSILPMVSLRSQTKEGGVSKESSEEVLIADKDKKPNVLLEKVKAAEEMLLEEEEDLLYPADELYGTNWDTRWVNPYSSDTSGIVFPDSCLIDFTTFFMPLAKDTVKVTSQYGPRRRRMHRGIDLKLQIGDTVYAAFDGKIRISYFERRGYGNYLVIRHSNGLETIYGHLSQSLVNVNDIVHAGDPIALGGNTGRSTGSHLHFETRFLGQAFNPADVINFADGSPYKDVYVFRNIKLNGRNTNIYTATDEQIIYHTVKSGETLGVIANKYKISIGELCRMNKMTTSSKLRIGQSLRCGIGNGHAEIPVKEENTTEQTLAGEAKKAKVTASITTTGSPSSPVYYKIREGDTLGSIATKHGVSVSKLCEMNNISQTTILKIGRSLRCS